MARVFVGLSGGVDSAVSAALLKEQGHDVTGVFIKIWSPEFLECTWRDDRLDAKRAAVSLKIPFLEIDLSREYFNEVIRDMVENYKSGKTPNPDVLCNSVIKFGSFKKWAFEQGAEAIATGHYARIHHEQTRNVLMRGFDTSKDQSYFLYGLSEDDLAKIYFPVGDLTKIEVREKALALGLPVAKKPDSQGLCFVGDVSMRDFLKRFIDVSDGSVIDSDGRTIGTHEGAALYTLGERHGFTVGNNSGEPYFITDISVQKNTITVSKKREDALNKNARVSAMHWLTPSTQKSFSAHLVTRYRGPAVKALVTIVDSGAIFALDEKMLISPGQSLVIYKNDVVLGGGILD